MASANKPTGKYRNLARFSGVGIQIGLTIYLGSIFGKWLDEKYEFEKPYFTLSIIILCFGLSMFLLITKLNKWNNENN